jgi:predicted ferric reductase
VTPDVATRPAPGHSPSGAERAGQVWPGLVAVATMVVAVGLWLNQHGVSDFLAPQTAMSSLGRITGLVSADLLLIQVFLMARVPWVERAWGQDRLARWHRLTGLTSFDLMLAHIVAITVAYAVSAQVNLAREAWNLLIDYPGMLLAVAGTAALTLVVVTSVRAARRRLRYESWHLLHLYAYLGVGLAIPHELWTGTDFVTTAWARTYWWTAYGVAAGSMLVFRIGIPVWRNRRHRFEVASVVTEAPGIVSVWLTGQRLPELPVRPGQFFTWRFRSGPGWTRAHPYSLSAAPRSDRLRITVKEVGDGSTQLAGLRPGTRVLVEGPYGAMTPAARRCDRSTLIAAGIGVTPMLALLDDPSFAPVTLLYRTHDERDIPFRSELDKLGQHDGVRVVYLSGPRAEDGSWAPAGRGDDDELLAELVPDLAEQDVFICGPDGWMAAVLRSCQELGVPAAQLHLEHFSW